MTGTHTHRVSEADQIGQTPADLASLCPVQNDGDDSSANIDETQPLLNGGVDRDANPSSTPQASDDAARSTTLRFHDDETSKRVLKKIDRVIIPLLFVTYMFNFMDKAILSSAAVFGLREDNVQHRHPTISFCIVYANFYDRN